MAERDTQLDSISAIQAAEDICRESADRVLAGKLDKNWDNKVLERAHFDYKRARLVKLRALKSYLSKVGEDGTDCSINTGIWEKVLERDLRKVK